MRNNWRSILFDVAKRQLFRLCLVSSISGLVRGVLSSDEIFACCILLHPVALFFLYALWGQLARNLQQWSPQQIYCDQQHKFTCIFFPENVHNLFSRLTSAWFSTQTKWHYTPQAPEPSKWLFPSMNNQEWCKEAMPAMPVNTSKRRVHCIRPALFIRSKI